MSILSINDTMYFGKNKGMNVGKMIVEDTAYACWLRDERQKTDPRPANRVFDFEANHIIDEAIKVSKSLSKKFRPWNHIHPEVLKASQEFIAKAAKAEAEKDELELAELEEFAYVERSKEVAYADSWGAW